MVFPYHVTGYMERTSAPGPARLAHLRLLLLWEGQLERGRLDGKLLA